MKMRPVEPSKADFFDMAFDADNLSRHGRSHFADFVQLCLGHVFLSRFI
jgi:hypothetical protein